MLFMKQYRKSGIIVLLIMIGLFFIKFYSSDSNTALNETNNFSVDSISVINSERFRLLTSNYSDFTHIFLFSRDTCPSCVEAEPIIYKVFSELPNDYYVSYYDTDKNRHEVDFDQIAKDYNIEKVPTVLVFNYAENRLVKIDDLETIMNHKKLLDSIVN